MKAILLRIDEKLYEKIVKFSLDNNISISSAIRGLIIRGLKSVVGKNEMEKKIGEIQIDNNKKIVVYLEEI
ncbi:MAG: hypothetical protein QXT38_01890 [Candidatus Aenigmatarchaeota archaeon]